MVLLDGMIAMREASRAVLMMVLVLVVSNPVQSQSITVDGNVETDAQLVTKATDGTAPLVVSSSTKVDNLNADSLDGLDSATFAREVDFQNLRSLLFRLQSQIDNLALLPMTGQTACFDAAGSSTTCTSGVGMGQDAYFRAGMPWPNPRFVRHGNGTVTDELTGLIWLENANCFNAQGWTAALAAAKELYDGSTNDLMGGDCGLSDGSVQGQWRLPNLQDVHGVDEQRSPPPCRIQRGPASGPRATRLPTCSRASTGPLLPTTRTRRERGRWTCGTVPSPPRRRSFSPCMSGPFAAESGDHRW